MRTVELIWARLGSSLVSNCLIENGLCWESSFQCSVLLEMEQLCVCTLLMCKVSFFFLHMPEVKSADFLVLRGGYVTFVFRKIFSCEIMNFSCRFRVGVYYIF